MRSVARGSASISSPPPPLPEEIGEAIVDAVASLTWPLGRRSLIATLRGSLKAPPSARRSLAYRILAAATDADVRRWVGLVETSGALVEVTTPDGFRVLHVDSSVPPPRIGTGVLHRCRRGSRRAPAQLATRALAGGRRPAYVVLHDATLRELAAIRPQTLDELAGIKGFGPVKVERYGDDLLAVLATGIARCRDSPALPRMTGENANPVEVSMSEKMWGGEPFWGLGYEWDPDWVLTDRQKELRATLIELCEKEMRANAKRSDDELLFPRRNLELLGEHGFLALTVPEEYGGLGENHVAYAMTCETIARYGCASTAMCYVMHIGAVNAIMLRPTDELIERYIRPLNSGKIGTLSYSDPETGSHFWYPISSGAERVNGGFKVRKKASWTTSAGFADFYVVQTTSPDFSGYDDLSVFVIDGEEVAGAAVAVGRARPPREPVRPARGARRRDPGRADRRPGRRRRGVERRVRRPVVPDRLVVRLERDRARHDRHREAAHDAQAARRRRPPRRRLPDDPGLRRRGAHGHERRALFVLSVAQAMDNATDDNTKVLASASSRAPTSCTGPGRSSSRRRRTSPTSSTRCCHACGGSGYKRDMELERYLRDAKAGWVMGPTNEVLRQFVGKAVLLGFDALDYWNQTYNRRAVENEVKKLDADGKRELAEKLMAEAAEMEAKAPAKA